jgi:ABC-type uncharacterized transport system ATPase subunit
MDTVAPVEVKNLRKTYGHVVAVDDLSFTIDHGEVFALLGPNGAGRAPPCARSYSASCGRSPTRSGPESDRPKRRAAGDEGERR